MNEPILRTVNEAYFTVFPTGFFLQILDGIAALFNFIFSLFGVETNIIGF